MADEYVDPDWSVSRYDSPTWQVDNTPTAKVTIGTLAGAAVTVLISVAKSFNIELEPEVAGALVTLIGFGAAYYKASRPADIDH